MACYRPLTAYQSGDGSVFFVERKCRDCVRTLQLSCGQCIGCRLERSRQWAVRCLHEKQMWKKSCFVTLTYDDAHVPAFGSLVYRDFQLFMKRLRKAAPGGLRFYMCGEYGELNRRPHYHALLFNYDFPDKIPVKLLTPSEAFRSELLSSLWPLGYSSIGEVNFESAAYVARYCVAKITGDAADVHYSVVNTDTGEISKRVPEFNHMSLKPGIGAHWYEKFKSDVFPRGYVVVRGAKARPPKYYDRKFAKEDPDGFAIIAMDREHFAHDRSVDATPSRLKVREVVASARVRSLSRSL